MTAHQMAKGLFTAFLLTALLPSIAAAGVSSHLTPPDGSALPDARGNVVINPNHFIVNVEGLPPGEYSVLLDDGTGTKTEIGKITVVADDEEGEEGEDEGEGDEGDDDDDDSGTLKLTGDALPFGAESPSDLGGRAICVKDGAGAILLEGTTPSGIAGHPEPRSGRCPLARPEPPVDEDAEGVLKLESGGERIVIKVHVSNLEPGTVFDVVITNGGGTSESLGTLTTNAAGNGQFKVDSQKGDPIPFGAGDLSALVGFDVDVKDPSGATVLTGTICEPQEHGDGGDGNGGPGGGDKPKPRCHSAQLTGDQEVPPVVTTATGTGNFVFTGPDGLTLRYEVTVEGLSGPATLAHIHEGAVGADGPPIITLDHEALEGAIEITAEQAAVITSGNAYVNVHTAANPDGEIRGQLTPCPDDEDDGDDEEEEEEEESSGEGGGGEVVDPLFIMVGEFDALFLRGDANADGTVNISDPLSIFGHLFSGGARPYCLDAADANDNGSVDISDAIALLSYLFQGSTGPASPGTLIPGSDETPDALYCLEQGA